MNVIKRIWLTQLANALARGLGRTTDTRPFARVFSERGMVILRQHYYLPIPDADDMAHVRRSSLRGLVLDDEALLDCHQHVVLRYLREFQTTLQSGIRGFNLANGTFMAGDAHAYYAFVRSLRPRRIVEIGCGNSTVVANEALRRNREESADTGFSFIAIDPYPGDVVNSLECLSEIRRCKLQDVPVEFFTTLEANDILFIDSSHVLKSGGDVWMEYCEIIPALSPGVYVHVHDISLPKPYPQTYFESGWFWNEQYLLQALLTGNDHLEVLWPGTYLFDKYPNLRDDFSREFDEMCSVYPLAEPTSFWMRTR